MVCCSICGGILRPSVGEVSDALTGESFAIFACAGCGVKQTVPQPDDLGIYYRGYHGGRHGFTAKFRVWRRIRMLAQRSGDERLMDVGCGDGGFLTAAENLGWNVSGTELDAARNQQQDLEVFSGLSEASEKYGGSSFAAITMWHTLEHFKDPKEVLEDARRLLTPDGTILIAVPNSESLQARLFGKYWLHNDVPRHLFHFSPDSLQRLLRQAGFEVIESKHHEFEYDLLGWSQSALNFFNREPNTFFNILRGRTEGLSRLTILLNFVFGAALSTAALPLLPISATLGRGASLIVRAKKMIN